MYLCSLVWSAGSHSSSQRVLSQLCLETSSGIWWRRWWACSENGRLDFRRARGGFSVAILWRRWSSLVFALRDSTSAAASRRRAGGAIPERMGSWLTGVGRRQPETVRMALLSPFVCELLHQTGAQYSAAD